MGKKIMLTVDQLAEADLLTLKEVADALHTTPNAVRLMITRGKSPDYLRIGSRTMFIKQAVNEWLAQ